MVHPINLSLKDKESAMNYSCSNGKMTTNIILKASTACTECGFFAGITSVSP